MTLVRKKVVKMNIMDEISNEVNDDVKLLKMNIFWGLLSVHTDVEKLIDAIGKEKADQWLEKVRKLEDKSIWMN